MAAPADIDAVLLWPGAGSSSEHSSLVLIEEELAPLPVYRFDFPYRREGRKPPDRANKLLLSLRDDVAAVCDELGTTPDRLVLGGRSMGGRMCSMAIAGETGNTAKGSERFTDPLPAAGLILIAYPLHPPGRPDKLRTAHLGAVTVPTLFLSGDRDAFGTPAELAAAQELIPADVTSHTIEKGTHELKHADVELAGRIRDWLGRSTRGRNVEPARRRLSG